MFLVLCIDSTQTFRFQTKFYLQYDYRRLPYLESTSTLSSAFKILQLHGASVQTTVQRWWPPCTRPKSCSLDAIVSKRHFYNPIFSRRDYLSLKSNLLVCVWVWVWVWVWVCMNASFQQSKCYCLLCCHLVIKAVIFVWINLSLKF